MSSDQPTPPAHLDEKGIRLWQAFIETGTRFRDARREHRAAKRAHWARIAPGTPPDPARLARYLAAHEAVEVWRDAHALASQEYHAYTRRRIAQVAITPRSQRTCRSANEPT